MNPTVREIIEAIEEKARPEWQESFDNTGWQILMPGAIDEECTGALLCVDVTPDIVEEARARKCNLIITHHPLLFHGLKRIDSENRVGQCVMDVIQDSISVYSCHTSIDSSPWGVSHYLGRELGLENMEVLKPGNYPDVGLGVVGDLSEPLSAKELVKRIASVTHSPVGRCSGVPSDSVRIKRVAVAGGACGDMIPLALAKGAEAMITSDVKHNQFIDHESRIMVVDLGHYETEECTKAIFYDIITGKFPNFVPCYSEVEQNPITYL
ncbi:MAG: Nif3-like dinuclear metal center hexameric protein [Muribaculaceae bacterium]|nr:Nif3-like dinuclear metal center hexameric protein [Muribaculaceae bacterium]